MGPIPGGRPGSAFPCQSGSRSTAPRAVGGSAFPALADSTAEEPRTESLPERLVAHLARRPRLLPPGCRILLAVSGGPDSVALLRLTHVLAAPHGWELISAHFDHGLRADSPAEAARVRAWSEDLGVPCRVGRPTRPLAARQAALRSARYAFLHEVAVAEGASRIATAHHADDQAETVLFRILRGTGVRGLAGIPERRGDVVRPLLGFWRHELEGYLRESGVPYLTDPSNVDPRWQRAVIRTRTLPALEAAWDGPVRERLLSLARSAASAERALLAQAKQAVARSELTPDGTEFRFVRPRLARYHPAVQARALALVAERLDVRLSRGGTRIAVEFMKGGRSGASVDIGGGLRLHREFDEFRLGPVAGAAAAAERSESLSISSERGEAELELAGRRFRVRWSPADRRLAGPEGSRTMGRQRRNDAGSGRYVVRGEGTPLPLEVRGWRPGDRIRLKGGSRRLKRLFGDRRVPLSERRRVPVLSDGSGRLLWVWGVVRAAPEVEDGEAEPPARLLIEICEIEQGEGTASPG